MGTTGPGSPPPLAPEPVPGSSGMCDSEQQIAGREVWKGGAGSCLQVADPAPPTLINSHFPSLEHPGGAHSFYLKLETSILLDLQARGAGGSGWLLRYLLNGNGVERWHRH